MHPDALPNSTLNKISVLFRLLPLVSFMTVIFFLSHTPGDNFPSILVGMDKLAHMTAYAVLGLTFLYAITPFCKKNSFFTIAIFTTFFCLVHGLADEFHQSFIPGRSPDIKDIVADVVGGLLAVCLWKIFLWRKKQYFR